MNQSVKRTVRGWTFAVVIVVASLVPTTVWADSAGPTDYRTDIVSVQPDPADAVTFSIEGGDAFVRARVAPGHTLVVYGYDGEEYVKVEADGAVFENRASESYFYNRERFGGDVPDGADSNAAAQWVQVDDDGEYAWHDHRAHWMSTSPLIGMRVGDAFPEQVIEVAVDQRPTEVTVRTVLQAKASPVWAVIGTVVGLAGATVIMVRRRWAQLGSVAVAVAGLVVGVAQALSVPASTGRPMIWWALPLAGVATALTGYAMRGDRTLVTMVWCAVTAELWVWSWPRMNGLLDAYRPTILPGAMDRVATIAIPIAALGLVGATARWWFQPDGSPSEIRRGRAGRRSAPQP